MTQGIDRLTVLGGGVLGGQIAWHSAYSGKIVTVYDAFDEGLENCKRAHDGYAGIYQQDVGASAEQVEATYGRLSYSVDLAKAVAEADLVIEAVPEVAEIKIEVYRKLSDLLPERTLLATNSSTMLPSQFAEVTGRPEKYCALHFANLIWSVNLAEVMAHPGTSEDTLRAITRFAIEIGMVPVPIEKEQNGYVINTLLVPLLNAAQTLVTNGVSDHETVDRTYMIMNRGCERGPFGTFDVIGMKTAYDALSYMGQLTGDEQMAANAAYLKENFLDKGLLGLQTGRGYYTYPNPSYESPDFLEVPDLSRVEGFARPTFPKGE
jgi:3-hydroxybutyryl-CoA dehydrogenase